ncbi:MAG: DUF362 domain-containing protein [Dehalococcoidales bacterium]|nr:DUF362 domain-containing protein [Dehalococcoidales bacterium]
MINVSITNTEKDFYTALTNAINGTGVRLIAPGDCVLIKPNLVEPAHPNSGQITNPYVIEAVARYCLEYGAKSVIIGEGPSYYQPQSHLRDCFTHTGVSDVAKKLGIEWILFDEHEYRVFRDISDCTPPEFRITEFAFNCDKFINLPVLKTHWLTRVTLAMKNLKGCLKREDKPLFHRIDLPRAVVELSKIIKPTINIIDCTPNTIVRQMSTSYYNPKNEKSIGKLLIASTDIVAADTVGSALMGIDPADVDTITLGAKAGLGENNLTRINISGDDLKQLKFKVSLPQEQLQQSFPLLEITGADKACSGCLIPLISSLLFLAERNAKLSYPLQICLGNNPKVVENKTCLLVGDCAQIKDNNELNRITGCPPNREVIFNTLTKYISY